MPEITGPWQHEKNLLIVAIKQEEPYTNFISELIRTGRHQFNY
jgi:hypothetical protein